MVNIYIRNENYNIVFKNIKIQNSPNNIFKEKLYKFIKKYPNCLNFIKAYFFVINEIKKFDNSNLNKNIIPFQNECLILSECVDFFNKNVIQLLYYYKSDNYTFYQNREKCNLLINYIQKNNKCLIPYYGGKEKEKNLWYKIFFIQEDKLDLLKSIIKIINEFDENEENIFNYLLKSNFKLKVIGNIYKKLSEIENINISLNCFRDSTYYNMILNNKILLEQFIENGLYINNEKKSIMDIVIKLKLVDLGKRIIEMNSSIINKKNYDGKLPIIIAFEELDSGMEEIIDLLLKFNVDVNKKSNNHTNQTVFSYVIEKNIDLYSEKIIKYIKNVDLKIKEKVLSKAIKYFLIMKDYEHIDSLVNKYKIINENLIKNEIEKSINNKEFKLNLKKNNKNGINFIYFICKNGFNKIVELILNLNISFNIFKGKSETILSPFLIALKNKHLNTIKLLLNSNNIKDKYLKNFNNDITHPLYYIYKNRNENNIRINKFIYKLINIGIYIDIQWLKNEEYIKYMINNKEYLKAIKEGKLKIRNEDSITNINNINDLLNFTINKDLTILMKNLLKIENYPFSEIDLDEDPLLVALKLRKVPYIKLLLECNFFFKDKKDNKKNILYTLIKNNDSEIFKLFKEKLYQEEFECYIEDFINDIIRNGKKQIIKQYLKFLIDNLDKNEYNNYNMIENFVNEKCKYKSIIHNQCYTGNLKFLKKYLSISNAEINKKDKEDDNIPLMVSLKYKQYHISKYLLSLEGIDVNIKNKKGYTPLIYMIKYKIDEEEIFKAIIEKDKYINNSNYYKGMTPLIYAIIKNNIKAVRLLLDNEKVDKKKKGINNKSPINIVMKKKSKEILKILCEDFDENKKIINSDGKEKENNEIISTFSNKTNCDDNESNISELKSEDEKDKKNTFDESDSETEVESENSNTQNGKSIIENRIIKIKNNYYNENNDIIRNKVIELMKWIDKNEYEMVKSQLSKMTDAEREIILRQEDENCFTPLLKAIYKRDKNQSITNDSIVHLLLDFNVDINQENSNGLTSLLLAIKIEDIKMIELLIERNVEINHINKQGITSFTQALECSNPNILIKLVKNKAKIPVNSKELKLEIIQHLKKGNLSNIKYIIYNKDENISYIKGKLVKFNMTLLKKK
eukprot:jgi/Orpsp1_1/1179929/evm.model.c7180000071398.1